MPTDESWLYLAVFLDLHSRQVLGWATSAWMTTNSVVDALLMAQRQRRPGTGLLVHTTRGSQCASDRFHAPLKGRDDVFRMSRKGHCSDNGPAESYFHTRSHSALR